MPIIENKRKSVNRISGRFLAPGYNTVTDQELEIMAGNRHFKAQVKLGILAVVDSVPEEEETGHLNLGTAQAPSAKDVENLSVKDKTALVEKSTDADQLKVWLKADARKTVKAAIEDRLKELATAGKE